MHTAGYFAGCEETRKLVAVCGQDFRFRINLETAHGVVHAGRDLDCIVRRVLEKLEVIPVREVSEVLTRLGLLEKA